LLKPNKETGHKHVTSSVYKLIYQTCTQSYIYAKFEENDAEQDLTSTNSTSKLTIPKQPMLCTY